MGRPSHAQRRVEIKVRLLGPTLAKLDLICLDPFTAKLAYGERNTHLELALADYFEKYYPQRKDIP